MALKPPPPPWEVLQQVGELIGAGNFGSGVDKSARNLVQSALARLDVVSREEFDAQAKVLERSRQLIGELEGRVKALEEKLRASG